MIRSCQYISGYIGILLLVSACGQALPGGASGQGQVSAIASSNDQPVVASNVTPALPDRPTTSVGVGR